MSCLLIKTQIGSDDTSKSSTKQEIGSPGSRAFQRRRLPGIAGIVGTKCTLHIHM